MKVTVRGVGKTVTVETAPGETAASAVKSAGVFFQMPCGGRGRCGKCAVLVKGECGGLSEQEAALLSRSRMAGEHADGLARIACLCRVTGDCEIFVPSPGRVFVPGAVGVRAEYDGPAEGSCGVCADIGTTTVSSLLFSFETGGLLASSHRMNSQAAYGADVLSRIEYSNRGGLEALRESIVRQLGEMFGEMLLESGRRASEVGRVVVTGNTTMLHFLTGLDPRGIGAAPFTPQSLFGCERPAGEIFPDLERASLFLPPSISAYVGADVTCGILSTDLTRDGRPRLLIDAGTNGETALWDGGRILCCSAAAGPAFEGAEIEMGMPAFPGAVRHVKTLDGAVKCETIDGAPPAGVCGSGMISALDMMLKEGIMDGGGRILDSGHPFTDLVFDLPGVRAFMLGGGVYLTQKDIRNIQLVKASIAAGVNVLIAKAGMTPGSLERLYLSGGFGSTMDPGEASRVGLFPRELAGRAEAAGNTALAGASQLLFSRAAREKLSGITELAEEIPLSGNADFMDEYVKQMLFSDE
ncbi:MAG: ASKHA domain-containing protein [Synergistaceae bacterium]|nr:ASKHA domain-containing protein [Synergistaceae bacterium]